MNFTLTGEARTEHPFSLHCSPLQPTPMKVVEEHMAAFTACDWDPLLAIFNLIRAKERDPSGK